MCWHPEDKFLFSTCVWKSCEKIGLCHILALLPATFAPAYGMKVESRIKRKRYGREFQCNDADQKGRR